MHNVIGQQFSYCAYHFLLFAVLTFFSHCWCLLPMSLMAYVYMCVYVFPFICLGRCQQPTSKKLYVCEFIRTCMLCTTLPLLG